MQAPGDSGTPNPHFPQPPQRPGYRKSRQKRGPGCLIWGLLGILCIFLALAMVAGAAVIGWNAGLDIARSQATQTIAADLQQQCAHTASDIASGRSALVRTRLEYLQTRQPDLPCLNALIPRATALHQQPLPTAAPPPQPAATFPAPAMPTAAPAPAQVITGGAAYDLPALLAEAQADLNRADYQAAIDTLDALTGIDANFQPDLVSSLHFQALTSQATLLFRNGKLSEGILMTRRAEAFGDIRGLDLSYERLIAGLYLNAQRYKMTQPGEAVRLFSRIVYENGLEHYQGGQVIAELQEAHSNYGDALMGQGDPCAAKDQYVAALNLRPTEGSISLASLSTLRNSADEACSSLILTQQAAAAAISTADLTPPGIGVRFTPAAPSS